MTEFLVFSVYAPLASWGDIAVGESRGSWDRPSRSAMLGLIAGALGIERGDQVAHDGLEAGYGLAVRLDAAGAPMVDYHTTQTVTEPAVKKARAGRPSLSRAALFGATADRTTILSRRTYHQDAFSTIALWARSGATWPLAELRIALTRPWFVPYAGRKSNVLGLPLDPQITSAPTLAAAFDSRSLVPRGLSKLGTPDAVRRALALGSREVAHDPCAPDGFVSSLAPLRREERRDRSTHRGRWQFGPRTVEIGLWTPASDRNVSLLHSATPQ